MLKATFINSKGNGREEHVSGASGARAAFFASAKNAPATVSTLNRGCQRIFKTTACLLAVLLLSGCLFNIETESGAVGFGADELTKFLLDGEGDAPMMESEKPNNAELIAAYRDYINNNPNMSDKAMELLINTLDNGLESKTLQDDINSILAWEELRKETAVLLNDGLKQNLGDLLYAHRREMSENADAYDKYAVQITECLAIYNESETWKNYFYWATDITTLEQEFTRIQRYDVKPALEHIAKVSGADYGGVLGLLTLLGTAASTEQAEADGAGASIALPAPRQMTMDWLEGAKVLAKEKALKAVDEMKKLRSGKYLDLMETSLEVLAFYMLLDDNDTCCNHMSGYHYSDGLLAFYNKSNLEENFRNKLSSYGSGGDLTRYEDDNIINFLLFSKIGPDDMPAVADAQKKVVANIDDPVLYYDLVYHWLGVRLPAGVAEPDIDAPGVTDENVQARIIRSAASLLPPPYFIQPGYATRYVTIDGGRFYSKDVLPNSAYTSWRKVQEFYRGAEVSAAHSDKSANDIKSIWAQGSFGGLQLKYLYENQRSLLPDTQRMVKVLGKNMDTTLPYEEFIKGKLALIDKKQELVDCTDVLCRDHLISYHTIEPELVEYIEEKGRSFSEFYTKGMDFEKYNIRAFVQKYNIPREDFEALFPESGRAFQPYNIDAVYGPETAAMNYYSLSYIPGLPVNYNMNGGEGDAPDTQRVPEGKRFTLPTASAVGKKLIGWNTEPDGTGRSYLAYDSAVMPEGGIGWLYAIWENIPYKVYYSLSGMPDAEGVFYNDTYTIEDLPEGAYVPAGKALDGWYTSHYSLYNMPIPPDAYSLWGLDPLHIESRYKQRKGVFKPGEKIIMPPSDISFSPIWADASYKVIFDYNGVGAEAPLEESYAVGKRVFAPAISEIEGYKLLGWNTEPDGTGQSCTQSTSNILMPEHELILYAQWTANEHMVRYQFGTQGIDRRVSYGEEYVIEGLPAGVTPPDGMELDGWRASIASGLYDAPIQPEAYSLWGLDPDEPDKQRDGVYKAGEKITVPDHNITFNAVWKNVEYQANP